MANTDRAGQVYVPPERITSLQQIKTFHTKEIFKTGSSFFEDISKTIFKHVEKETSNKAYALAKGLNDMRRMATSADRVSQDITHGKILKDAIDNEDDLNVLNRMTGLDLSQEDAKHLKQYIDKYDQTSPLQNHEEHITNIVKEMGGATLRGGQVLPASIAERFRETTGKDINSVIPKAITDDYLKEQYRKHSQFILSSAVESGSLTYRNGLKEAARIFGKGSSNYEIVKLKMLQGLNKRLASNRANSVDNEQAALARMMRTDQNFLSIPKSDNPNTQQKLIQNFYSDLGTAVRSVIRGNQDMMATPSLLVKGIVDRLDDRGVSEKIKSEAHNRGLRQIREVLRPGFRVFTESFPEVSGFGLDKKSDDIELNSVEAVHLFDDYYRYYSAANRLVPGFQDMDESQKGARVAEVRKNVLSSFKNGFGIPTESDRKQTPTVVDDVQTLGFLANHFGIAPQEMLIYAYGKSGILPKEYMPLFESIDEQITNSYKARSRPVKPPPQENKTKGSWLDYLPFY